ncbi:MAG: FAD:protein FMN transferase [Desulfobacteraceae bacterium]|nr:FAD:protein FMN transferase [Desulfobacteraceae bacterium]
MNFSKTLFCVCLVSLFMFQFPFFSIASAKQHLLSGKTMGTFYNVKIVSGDKMDTVLWKKKIDIRLKDINNKLSMYSSKSEISRLNQTDKGIKFYLSDDLYAVLTQANNLFDMTNGAWDGTVKPLVDLWGFGTKKKITAIPGQGEINRVLTGIGFDKLIIEHNAITKKSDSVSLDLGSIAKGYGVDAIAALLKSCGFKDFLVEIGGELAASGKNQKGKTWKVGISKPNKKLSNQGLYKIITLDNRAIATSGNYRNYIEINGKFYSHIISPVTGFPVENQVVSASVIAKDCTFADGLATALMVMDVNKGIALVNGLENVECLIITQDENKKFHNIFSKHFK